MDSFENRVDKVFGSLGMSSSWRLSEEKPRVKVTTTPPSPQEEEEEEASFCAGGEYRGVEKCDGMDFEGDMEEEGRQVRGMVGLDATLDFEEEEDEFDKAAFGLEGNEERLYMMGIKEVDKKLVTSASLPLSLYDLKRVRRDPRANHSAARARLEEDARRLGATTASSSSWDSESADHSRSTVGDAGDVGIADQVITGAKRSNEARADNPDLKQASLSEPPSRMQEKGKPIKRVRFALDPEQQGHLEQNAQKVFIRHKANSNHVSQVPDHVRNPSKYTHYTLDWAVEEDEMSNIEAFKACDENLRKGLEEESSSLQEMPTKIQYIHRHGRATENIQKSNVEETNQSVLHVKRTMCIEHCETENENVEMISDDSMDSKNEELVTGFCTLVERKSDRPAKNYRLKREAVENMDI
eukprot:c2639_g1_i1 orf=276-1511(+)